MQQQQHLQKMRRNRPIFKSSIKTITTTKQKREPHPDMVVPKHIVNEILLIGSVIGSSDVSTTPKHSNSNSNNPIIDVDDPEFIPVSDSLQWLQDLQRVLRRDHDIYRPISLLLGTWNFVSQKLIPLCISSSHDKALVLTACKLLVILTKPMSGEAKKAGRLVVDVKSGNVEDSVVRQQIELRKNAIAQSDLLMEYKKLFVRHASHRYAFRTTTTNNTNNNNTNAKKSGLFSIFTNLLATPLSKIGSSRTSEDHLQIELVLHLIRNLLSISPLNTFGSPEKSQQDVQLHRELVVVLKEEEVLDVLMVLGQEVERRENQGYNLLLMEILGCLLRGQDPSDVALSATKPPTPSLSTPVTTHSNPKKKSKTTTPTKTRIVRTTAARASSSLGDSLKAHLQSERQKTQTLKSSRHSHFGGTLLISKPGGKRSYVSASDYLARGGKTATATAKVGASRRKNKMAEVFVGSGKSSSMNSRPGASATLSREAAGPNSKRAKVALHEFCTKFVEDCYGPLMKSLKNEFRRESSKLENGDKTFFFKIIWFFHQWWRVGREHRNEGAGKKDVGTKSEEADGLKKPNGSAQNLIFTMDVFMFNLVLTSTDEYFDHKKPAALAQAAALYTEMIHMLHAMYDSQDSTEHMMALGLMDRLFYANEPIDRLPKLLSRWTPGMYGREYLCDLVECTHVTLRLLDVNDRRCIESVAENESERRRPKDAVERMTLTALEFDKNHYFMRKFVSNQIVFMYTQLLSQYAVNAAHVNRHIAAYFIRLCKFSTKDIGADTGADDMEVDDALGKNYLATKTSTMEPILYNIGLFSVLDKVLNDPIIRDKEEFNSLLMFAASFMKRFALAAEANPVLYVEALFKHPNPQRFSESTANMYVNEELRMIAVRDLLLEDQRKYEQQADEDLYKEKQGKDEEEDGGAVNKTSGYDDDEEEELEFNDDDDIHMDTSGVGKKKRRRKSRKRRKSKAKSVMSEEDESDAEEEEVELNGNAGDIDEATTKDDEDNVSNEQENEQSSSEASGSILITQEGVDASPSDTFPSATNADDKIESPKLSGKKRIRKSQEAGDDEGDSDEEDFLGSSPGAAPAKVTRRVIFEDDDDE